MNLRIAGVALLAAMAAVSLGCGGGGTQSSGSPPPPPPEIALKVVGAFYSGTSSLNLPFAIAGQGAFTLLAGGSGFTSSSVVQWNGTALSTTFGDASDLARRRSRRAHRRSGHREHHG